MDARDSEISRRDVGLVRRGLGIILNRARSLIFRGEKGELLGWWIRVGTTRDEQAELRLYRIPRVI